ncbi:hypothetical protein S40288_04848 [Stachybotrys chartarum IBT 40288]|nr:hypothetical protein S40288_04848 [Stachybotrys chartarum IBT 40288]
MAAQKLCTIDGASIEQTDVAVSSSDGYEVLCSYNWTHQKQPTIYVPGIQFPLTLSQDSGNQSTDKNARRAPKYHYESVFRAIEIMKPTYLFDDVDVLINRNSLRKLLDLCAGRRQESFRINLYTVAKTLIVEMGEETIHKILHGSSQGGYGHNFEAAITAPWQGMEGSVAHDRVLQYELGGLRCAVRFEVDAYIDGTATGPASGMESLVDSFDALQMQPPATSTASGGHQALRVIPHGKLTEQSQSAEIKSWRKLKSTSTVIPQMWFGRTPWLVKGHHDGGTFYKMDVENAGEGFAQWESQKRNQCALRKMSSLLEQLRDVVRDTESKSGIAVYLRHGEGSALQVFATTSTRKTLPDDVVARFWSKGHAIPRG